jgi:hypothetical protein
MNQKEMEAKIAELTLAVSALNDRVEVLENGKQRGPKTERPMTEADAYRVKFGDMKLPMEHKKAAEALVVEKAPVVPLVAPASGVGPVVVAATEPASASKAGQPATFEPMQLNGDRNHG